jgi:predicted enzyme related to lactoylglutathione lyase
MKVMLSWYGVKDFEQSKKFYSEVLGLQKTTEMPGWAEFGHSKDDATIGVNGSPRDGVEPGATVVLQVDNVESERKRLESRGVKFEGKIEEVGGVVKIATFRDPSGNRLQLCQVLMQQS